ncbi:MAG: VOC family protein [Treponema sp.]|jgi:catechol 2,3-dioxygenase-like lactoylglutathione lyase family enzyme|nr:VOC family protein [Treponema sp.]
MAGVLESDVIVQVAFVVKDVEKTARKYADFFGMQVPEFTQSDPVETSHAVYRGKPTGGRNKQAIFNFGQVALELIQPDNGPSAWREALDQNGEGFHHIAFRVKDLPAKTAELEARGYTNIMTGSWTKQKEGGSNGMYSYIDATEDLKTVLELLERLD